MGDNIAIKVAGVYKDFKLPHEKVNTLKGVFTGLVSKKARSKGFESQHALKDISFEVKKGEFFGIVGRNGSGKSTLPCMASIFASICSMSVFSLFKASVILDTSFFFDFKTVLLIILCISLLTTDIMAHAYGRQYCCCRTL